MDFFEKTIHKETKFEGRVITVEVLDVELPDGNQSKREIVRHNGGAAVVPITPEGEIYLVRQFRKAYDEAILEIPAGKINKGEDPRECAIRELKEETGLTSNEIIHITDMYPSPGYTNEIIYIYAAKTVSEGESNTDEDEFLSVEKYHYTKLLEMIKEGIIKDSKTIIGILYAEKIIKSQI